MIVGIKCGLVHKIYYSEIEGKKVLNKKVIVETDRGVEVGTIVKENVEGNDKVRLNKIRRFATSYDIKKLNNLCQKELFAFNTCKALIEKRKLSMKLVKVEYLFDRQKVIFYFTSSSRVDFRALVRDLAKKFKTRIEMRQIGHREETRLLGGTGICGQCFCCSSFLTSFLHVTVDMAKDQGITLSPARVTGVCGRLKCCLRYEHDVYIKALKDFPSIDTKVKTPLGTGVISKLDPLAKSVYVILENEEMEKFNINEIEVIQDESK